MAVSRDHTSQWDSLLDPVSSAILKKNSLAPILLLATYAQFLYVEFIIQFIINSFTSLEVNKLDVISRCIWCCFFCFCFVY